MEGESSFNQVTEMSLGNEKSTFPQVAAEQPLHFWATPGEQHWENSWHLGSAQHSPKPGTSCYMYRTISVTWQLKAQLPFIMECLSHNLLTQGL